MGKHNKTSFKPGQSGNLKGRPTGATDTVKDWWDEFFDKDRPSIKDDWKKISPALRMQLRFRFLEFQIPKLRSEHVSVELDAMSEQMAGRIVAEVLTKTLKNEVKYKSPPGGDNDPGTDPA